MYQPVFPEECGLSTIGICQIRYKGRRSRGFGPVFDLTVVYCTTHDVCFTLYPPGFTPYGRRPLARLSPEGTDLSADPEHVPFENTLFQAVYDYAENRNWPKESHEGHAQLRFNTQLKQIDRCSLLLGLGRGSPPTFDDCLSHLGVAGTTLHAVRERVLAGEGYRNLSEAACELLTQIGEYRGLFIGTSTLGHLAGLWPEPQVLFDSPGEKNGISIFRPWH